MTRDEILDKLVELRQSKTALKAQLIQVETAMDGLVEKLKGIKPVADPQAIPPHVRSKGRPRKPTSPEPAGELGPPGPDPQGQDDICPGCGFAKRNCNCIEIDPGDQAKIDDTMAAVDKRP